MVVVVCAWNDLHVVLERAVEGVGESDGESRCQKIDVELKIALGIKAMHGQSAAPSIRRADEIERQGPKREIFQRP